MKHMAALLIAIALSISTFCAAEEADGTAPGAWFVDGAFLCVPESFGADFGGGLMLLNERLVTQWSVYLTKDYDPDKFEVELADAIGGSEYTFQFDEEAPQKGVFQLVKADMPDAFDTRSHTESGDAAFVYLYFDLTALLPHFSSAKRLVVKRVDVEGKSYANNFRIGEKTYIYNLERWNDATEFCERANDNDGGGFFNF